MLRIAVVGRLIVVVLALIGLGWLLAYSDPASPDERSVGTLSAPGDPAPLPAGSSGLTLLEAGESGTATGESSGATAAEAAPDDPIAVRRAGLEETRARKRMERDARRAMKRAQRAQRRTEARVRDADAKADFQERERARGKTRPLLPAK